MKPARAEVVTIDGRAVLIVTEVETGESRQLELGRLALALLASSATVAMARDVRAHDARETGDG